MDNLENVNENISGQQENLKSNLDAQQTHMPSAMSSQGENLNTSFNTKQTNANVSGQQANANMNTGERQKYGYGDFIPMKMVEGYIAPFRKVSWGTTLFWGILVILFGLVALFTPHIALTTLIVLFGLFALFNGVLAIITSFMERRVFPLWWMHMAAGIVGVLFGLAVLTWPHETAIITLYLIAAWALVTGVFTLMSAFSSAHENGRPSWFLALAGVCGILLGLVLFFSYPYAALLSLVWVIGIYAILAGIMLIARAMSMRSLQLHNKTMGNQMQDVQDHAQTLQ